MNHPVYAAVSDDDYDSSDINFASVFLRRYGIIIDYISLCRLRCNI